MYRTVRKTLAGSRALRCELHELADSVKKSVYSARLNQDGVLLIGTKLFRDFLVYHLMTQ